ncbi:MAG: division/cell wall cluster transcriptional repressor MraZ [Candidatus Omnitrophota bacterium]
MKRFRGSFELKVDDRGRIKIPAQYHTTLTEQYGNTLYITSLNGDRVFLYPLKVWEGIEASIEQLKVRSPEIEEYLSRTSFWGNEAEVDDRGRVLIPPELRKAAQLNGSNLRVFGKIDHMLLWNEQLFRETSLGGEFSDEKLHVVSRLINEFSRSPGND